MNTPLISILIPAYNEQDDILQTLKAACLQDYPFKEVLLIDDASTDRTTDIAESLISVYPYLRIVRLSRNSGVAAARNVGLRDVKGEVVVILNADVVLPPNFLSRIMPHYVKGVDYLCVDSQVINTEFLFPRFMQALHEYWYRGKPEKIEWTEGYSCRREVALKIGGFPEIFPGAAGEDAVFGQKMAAAGYRKTYDPTIVAPHIAPHTMIAFWKQWCGRGRGSSYLDFVGTKNEPTKPLLSNCLLKSIKNFLSMSLYLRKIPKLTSYSLRGGKDFLPFMWTWLLVLLSWQRGYWIGISEIRSCDKLSMKYKT